MPESEKKHHFWEVNPKMFDRAQDSGTFVGRVIPALKSFAKHILYALALTYPVYSVVIGLVFGGLAFWLFLLASFAGFGVLLSLTGYSRNFAGWGEFSFKRLGAFFFAFLITAGLYMGLLYAKSWLVILAVTFLAAALVLFLALRNRK